MLDTETDKKTTDAAEIRQAARRVAHILIVDEHPNLRGVLKNLVDQQVGAGSCLQADNAEQASKTLQKQQVDFAIVNISAPNRRKPHLAETIKLSCPALPILAISVQTKKLPHGNTIEQEQQPPLNPDTAKRIVAGIKYVRSLSHSGVSGFTVVVKE